MRKLQITAVGSSPLIATEIQSLVQEILGDSWPVSTAVTNTLQKAAADTFYICAVTQGEKLQAIIPKDQLFIWELHPTTRFFLDIAKIPAGSDVYVFNNLLPYIAILEQECRTLGINSLHFHALAYDQMPTAQICDQLAKAHYVIGVECLLGEGALLSNRFRHALQPDVQLIPGRRSAAIQCVGQLLAAIADFYLTKMNAADDTEENRQKISLLITALKEAAGRAVISRLGTAATTSSAFAAEYPVGSLAEQRQLLAYLAQKLVYLSPN